MTFNNFFEIREAHPYEGKAISNIEHTCFREDVADDESVIIERAKRASDEVFVAIDKRNNKVAAYINGIATNEEELQDIFFDDNSFHDPDGKNVMILGIGVLPEYRNCGLARGLMSYLVKANAARQKEKIVLTCHAELIQMYENLGFALVGKSRSKLGNETWYEMEYRIESND